MKNLLNRSNPSRFLTYLGTFLTLAGLSTLSTEARAGGSGTRGGGGVFEIREADLKALFADDARGLRKILVEFIHFNPPEKFPADESRKIYQDLLTQGLLQDIEATKIQLAEREGECAAEGTDYPASTEIGVLRAPICVDLKKILAEIPTRDGLIALLMHEFAHHFGYTDAQLKGEKKFRFERAILDLASHQLAMEAFTRNAQGKAVVSDDPYAEYYQTSPLLQESRMPEMKDLRPGKVWHCDTFPLASVSQDAPTKSLPFYRFGAQSGPGGGTVHNTGIYAIPAYVSLIQYQASAGTADKRVVDYLKVTPSGGLIGESTISETHPLFHESQVWSKSNPGRKVIAYQVCSADRVSDESPTLAALDLYRDKGAAELWKKVQDSEIGSCRVSVNASRETKVRDRHASSNGNYRATYQHGVHKNYELLINEVTDTWIPEADWKVLAYSEITGNRPTTPPTWEEALLRNPSLSRAAGTPDSLSATEKGLVDRLVALLLSGRCEKPGNEQ